MARKLRFLSALSAFFVLAAVAAGCGSGVPGNAVARIGDEVITRAAFDHWLRVAALSSQPPGSAGRVTIPDAPTFRRCITERRRTLPAPPPGQPQVTEAQLRSQCRQEYDGLKMQVMQFLIQAEWIKGEAAEQKLRVSDQEVQRAFQQQKAQSFPQESEYQAFLRSSGMTQRDILLRVRLDLLSNKIRDKVTKGPTITNKQVENYYRRNRERFTQPEQRDLQVILTRSEGGARNARKAIENEEGWPATAKRYSVDEVSKRQDGKLNDVIPGQQEEAFDRAIFAAKIGELVGPIKTPFGYYVFRVTNITPAKEQSLGEVREAIKRILQSEGQQKRLETFVKTFEKTWKSRTNCRKEYVIELCENAPKPRRTSTVPPGAIPQPGGGSQGGPPPPGAPPPQGAPPQGAPPPPPPEGEPPPP